MFSRSNHRTVPLITRSCEQDQLISPWQQTIKTLRYFIIVICEGSFPYVYTNNDDFVAASNVRASESLWEPEASPPYPSKRQSQVIIKNTIFIFPPGQGPIENRFLFISSRSESLKEQNIFVSSKSESRISRLFQRPGEDESQRAVGYCH